MAPARDELPESVGERVTGDGEPAGGDSSAAAFAENWSPPEVLSDRYRMEEWIGQGGMGVVYRGLDTHLDLKVAVKLILHGTVERFRTEARSLIALNHANIVRVYDFNQQDGLHYIVMEYVEGESLASRIARDGPLAADEAVRITSSLCEALGHAHGQGIIHRDIKPSNVLLTGEGVPKLVDFGLARIESDQSHQTRAGVPLGTVDYMSPEQRRGAAGVDERSDLWSLGTTFYEMLTGDPPHPLDLDDVPLSMRSTIGKALKRDPDDRYQTADEFHDALKTVLDSSAPQAKGQKVEIADFVDNTEQYEGKTVMLGLRVDKGIEDDGTSRGIYLEEGTSLRDFVGKRVMFQQLGLSMLITIPNGLVVPKADYYAEVDVVFVCRNGSLTTGNEAVSIQRSQ